MLQKWGHITRHLDRSYVLLAGITRTSDQQAKGSSINDVDNFSGFFDPPSSPMSAVFSTIRRHFCPIFDLSPPLPTADVVYGQPLSGVTVAAALRRNRSAAYTPPPPRPFKLSFLITNNCFHSNSVLQ